MSAVSFAPSTDTGPASSHTTSSSSGRSSSHSRHSSSVHYVEEGGVVLSEHHHREYRRLCITWGEDSIVAYNYLDFCITRESKIQAQLEKKGEKLKRKLANNRPKGSRFRYWLEQLRLRNSREGLERPIWYKEMWRWD